MENKDVVIKFYEAFARGDAEEMINCYSHKIVFTDPAFGTLRGKEVGNMWRMLVHKSNGDIKITFTNVHADNEKGRADWVAEYNFSQTGRPVKNRISAQFDFENGKITRHTDHFNMWKWTRQALGWKGALLGWSPFMKNKIQQQTKNLLHKYQLKAGNNEEPK